MNDTPTVDLGPEDEIPPPDERDELIAELVKALRRIELGTPDDLPPYRVMPADELRRIAREAMSKFVKFVGNTE